MTLVIKNKKKEKSELELSSVFCLLLLLPSSYPVLPSINASIDLANRADHDIDGKIKVINP